MIIYITADGLAKIETTFDGDTVWLSKAQMAELFQRDRSVISKHIKMLEQRKNKSVKPILMMCDLRRLRIRLFNEKTVEVMRKDESYGKGKCYS